MPIPRITKLTLEPILSQAVPTICESLAVTRRCAFNGFEGDTGLLKFSGMDYGAVKAAQIALELALSSIRGDKIRLQLLNDNV